MNILETCFKDQLEEASGPEIVSMFLAHREWTNYVIVKSAKDKEQKRRIFNLYSKYNEEFVSYLVIGMI